MRKSFFVLLCILCTTLFNHKTHAQKWLLGVKGGITVPNLRSPDDPGQLNSGYKSILGPEFGIIAERRFNKLFSIQSEIIYTSGGGVKSGVQRIKGSAIKDKFPAFNPPEFLYADFESRVKLTYIDLPIMAKFSFPIGLKTKLSVMGGGFIGYLTSARNYIKGTDRLYEDPQRTTPWQQYGGVIEADIDTDIIDECNQFNYGIQGGLGISRSLLGWELALNAGGNYGLAYLQKDEKYGKNQTGAVTITFAILKSF